MNPAAKGIVTMLNTPLTLVQPCPPHEWGHAPTVGYFHCGKCQRTVMFDDPEYKEIEAAQSSGGNTNGED